MAKRNFYNNEDELDIYGRDDYAYNDYNDDEDDMFEGYKKKKLHLESEYDNDDGYDDEENEKSYELDEEDEDIRNRLKRSDDDEDLLRELDELDESDFFNEDDDDEDTPVEKPKRKRRKKGEAKSDKLDMSGSAVRNRFYLIMEDYHSGDDLRKQNALERAMKELEGFIHLIIKRSYSTYTKKYFYDLLQEGYLGVAIGMEKYNPDMSMPSTFFYPYIKHEMQGFITRNVDKTTSHYSANIKKINKAIQELEEKGVRYTNVDIALQTGMTIETVDQSMAIRKYRDEVHIDACPPNVIDSEMEENRHITPEQEYMERETVDTIYRTIRTLLTEDEIQVLTLHFGLWDTDTVSEGEIARQMSIPKDKVKRLLNRAIRKLRQSELANVFGDNMIKEDKFLEDIDISIIPRDAAESDIEFLSQIDDIVGD